MHFKKKSQGLLLGLFLIGTNYLLCQDRLSIEGIIRDSNTKVPILDAYICASESKRGTISNENGEFSLSGISLVKDTLIISHLNYQTFVKKCNEFSEDSLAISLEPKNIVLDEVLVTAVNAKKLALKVQNFLKNTPVEYGRGFYRQKSFRDSLPMEWIEAFYNVAYSIIGIEKIRIDQARFARKKYDTLNLFISHTNFSYLTVGNAIYSSVSKDKSNIVGKPFSEDFIKNYDFFVSAKYQNDSNIYYVIDFKSLD